MIYTNKISIIIGDLKIMIIYNQEMGDAYLNCIETNDKHINKGTFCIFSWYHVTEENNCYIK